MNKIVELYNSISDDDLREAILEIKESEVTGFIKEGGYVRKWANLSGKLTGGFTSTDFYMTITNLLKVAAFRWAEQKF